MDLDFSGLDELAQKKQPHRKPQERILGAGEYDFTQEEKSAGNAPKTPQNGTQQLQREADQKRQAIEQAAAVYKQYQENIKATGTLRAEILKGVTAGEDLEQLFLKAAKALSLLLSDELFYRQIERTLADRRE